MTIKSPPTASATTEPSTSFPSSNLAASLSSYDMKYEPNTTFLSSMAATETKSETTFTGVKPEPTFTVNETTSANATQTSQFSGATNQNTTQQTTANPAQGQNGTTNAPDSTNLNMFAQQMLQQLATTPEGRAQVQQMQFKMLPDGRMIPSPGEGVAHVYLKDIGPRPPANLPDMDGNVWSELSMRMAPIRARIMKALYCFTATGFIVTMLCVGAQFVLPPVASPAVLMIAGVCFGLFVFANRGKKKAMDEEVKAICTELNPKFQIKGYQLEYFEAMNMLLVSRVVENTV